MSPEMEAFLLKRFRETYDAGRRGTPRDQVIDLAVIVTGAQIDEEVRRQVLQPQGQRP
jgi:hypothetical protein